MADNENEAMRWIEVTNKTDDNTTAERKENEPSDNENDKEKMKKYKKKGK
jgi:hypothetical protein